MQNIENPKKYPIGILSPKGLSAVSVLQPLNNAKSGLFIMEIWKDIKGYEGYYQVSNYGKIKSLERFRENGFGGYIHKERILKSQTGCNGYEFINLSKKGIVKHLCIHRFVAIAFIPNPEDKPCTNHKNGIRTDNRLSNLEWATYSENAIHGIKRNGNWIVKGEKHPKAFFKNSDILKIRHLYKSKKMRKCEIAKKYNTNQSTIHSIIIRKSWKHI